MMIPECPVVEVFKTNVSQPGDAARLVWEIESRFSGLQANFDLEDCDRILRTEGSVNAPLVLGLLTEFGFEGAILE